VNVTNRNGTAPVIDCTRFTDDGAGALEGAVFDEVAVMLTPAGAPGATAIEAV
jgi:hypothetical protein